MGAPAPEPELGWVLQWLARTAARPRWAMRPAILQLTRQALLLQCPTFQAFLVKSRSQQGPLHQKETRQDPLLRTLSLPSRLVQKVTL